MNSGMASMVTTKATRLLLLARAPEAPARTGGAPAPSPHHDALSPARGIGMAMLIGSFCWLALIELLA